MKGDFTRDTFKPDKHYQQVLMQQGRAQLDADWNEQAAIDSRRDATTTNALTGHCGGPADHAAFGLFTAPARLSAHDKARLTALFGALPAAQQPVDLSGTTPTFALKRPGDFFLSPGRYYVDGVQCENEFAIPFSAQPDRLDAPTLPVLTQGQPPKPYLVFLDVWHRHITALDDGGIREPALGGPDTGTRIKTVWQVRALEMGEPNADSPCATPVGASDALLQPSDARLTADTAKTTSDDDPCEVPESAGYKSLENQLYRVEIHLPTGATGGPTFKWSRENGSVVTAITRINGDTLTVASLGPDDRLGFRTDDWVEILDDALELDGKPGQLLQVADFNEADRTLKLKSAAPPLATGAAFPDGVDASRHPKVRRWEGTAAVVENSFLPLESGVQVRFDNSTATYRTGDYWQIPARAATATAPAGDIEWPRQDLADATTPRLSLSPRGVKHHYCRLGIAQVAANGDITLTDCRCLYPAATAVPRLFYVGGDGQEVMPDLTQTAQFFELPQSLVVGVPNAQCLDQPLRVRFKITAGSGRVAPQGGAPTEQIVEVTTDAGGLASCDFYLDGANASQQVTARLLDAANAETSLPIIFNANLSLASQVAYQPGQCALLQPARDVQTALDILCASMGHGGCCVTIGPGGDFPTIDAALKTLFPKTRDICLCLLSGDHRASDFNLANDGKGDLHVRIAGCGRGTRLRLARPARFQGLTSFTLRELEIFSTANLDNGMATIGFDSCEEVTITGCRIASTTEPGALLSIRDADRVRLTDNYLEASLRGSLVPTIKVFSQPSSGFLAELYGIPDWPKFNDAVGDFGARLAKLDAATRSAIREELQKALANPDLRTVLSTGELLALTKLNLALAGDKTDASFLADVLGDIRTAGIKARAGLAVILGELRTLAVNDVSGLAGLDDDDFLLLENNEIAGVVCLMGQPEGNGLNADEIKKLITLLKAAPATVRVSGLSGTLQLRGNQLTRVAVAQRIVDQLRQIMAAGTGTITNVFGRCAVTDNVFEDGLSQIVCQQLSLTANKFTFSARPVAAAAVVTFLPSFNAGTSIADNAVFLGNQARGQRVFWQDISRISDKAANVELSLV